MALSKKKLVRPTAAEFGAVVDQINKNTARMNQINDTLMLLVDALQRNGGKRIKNVR